MKNKKGLLVIIAGPTGCGKGSLIRGLLHRHPEYTTTLSLTTRKKRPNEVDGKGYCFVTPEEFFAAREDGKLLEWALVHETEYYGVLKEPVVEAMDAGKVVLREMNIDGIESMKRLFSDKQLLVIFLVVSTWASLQRRVLERAFMGVDELEARKRSYIKEMEAAQTVADYLVVNEYGKETETLDRVNEIVEKEIEKRRL